MRRPTLAAAVLVPLALALAACSVSANLTVAADSLASKAEDALQEQTGADYAPVIDCGEDPVDLVEGEVVDCVLTDERAGSDYDTAITLTKVDGTKYSIDIEVAEQPRGSSGDGSTAGPTDATLTVPSTDLASLAAGALADQLGYRPEIGCAPEDVPLVEGGAVECPIQGQDGVASTVVITITEVDGTDYKINAVIQ